MSELRPYFERFGAANGIDFRIVAAVAFQESSFRNFRVHYDGTGHGLFGLDDNGLLPDFERWCGVSFGRGTAAAMIPPAKQIEYATMQLAKYMRQYGSALTACAVWHRGAGNWQDELGTRYIALIQAHVRTLFGSSL